MKVFYVIIVSFLIFSCATTNSALPKDSALANDELAYQTAWGTTEVMKINPNVMGHVYDFSKLVMSGQKFVYDDARFTLKHGIDVSSHEKEIDWEKAKNDGVEFAFLRIAFRRYGESGKLEFDDFFKRNLQETKRLGIPVGAYVFSQAVNEDEALEEARIVMENISSEDLELPVVFDPESIRWDDARTDSVTGEQFTKNTIAFCEELRKHGFDVMIYSNMTWESNFFDMEKLSEYGYPVWFADYEKVPQTPYHFVFWQYSCSGKVDGINRPVDLNVWFCPNPSISEL